MRAGLSCGGDYFWGHERFTEPADAIETLAAELLDAGRTQHAAAHQLHRKAAQPKSPNEIVMSDRELKSTTLASRASSLGYPTNLLAPGQTYETVNRTISDIPLKRAPGPWWVGFIIASLLLLMFLVAVTWLFIKGIGIWGVNIPVAWGFAIVNSVWWVGI